MPEKENRVIVVGGGFTGLAAAYELVKSGVQVDLYEKDRELGGLAGSFDVDGVSLEKFYHHWFTNDQWIQQLVLELEKEDEIIMRPTKTGMYYANSFYRLSTPIDLLRFKALSLVDRIRLGLLALKARRVKDWRELEGLTAEEWLVNLGGRNVYEVVWKPLIDNKFGPYAADVSAVWIWNKLKLRGGSRGKGGAEFLAYYRGGFSALAGAIVDSLEKNGAVIHRECPVKSIEVEHGRVAGVKVENGEVHCADHVLATVHYPQYLSLIDKHVSQTYKDSLLDVDYLANVCLVLFLDRSLSDLYWINVNDTSFPYVGVIEHTNFEPPETYGGKHVVYLSRYLPHTEKLYQMTPQEVLEFSIPHIVKMFPDFKKEWILDFRVWNERFSQPVIDQGYSQKIPSFQTPVKGLYLSSMAQIYPEDRGTNYAVREGREAGRKIVKMI